MKKVILYSIVFLTVAVSLAFTYRPLSTPEGFVLIGKINAFPDKYIYLAHTANGAAVEDSCVVKDGTFNFRLTMPEPQMLFFA